ncbi:Cyclic pyranopterin monophosphate synthase [Pseudomonas aeruginosa]|nr:Cyclic pyranopterin monophosphate synthase [Pseudomonas aeruginosa]
MTDWIDGQGRQIDYLRLSVTDRCDFRCVYCMAEDMRFLPRQQVLTLEEIERVARLFVAGGVRKLRLTGGPASSACASAWRHCRGCANCA